MSIPRDNKIKSYTPFYAHCSTTAKAQGKYTRRQNIERYRRLLRSATDKARGEYLNRLIIEEQQKQMDAGDFKLPILIALGQRFLETNVQPCPRPLFFVKLNIGVELSNFVQRFAVNDYLERSLLANVVARHIHTTSIEAGQKVWPSEGDCL